MLLPVAGLGVLLVPVSSGAALLLGVALALTIGNPWPERTRALGRYALTGSVVGLGAGMNLLVVGRIGLHGLGYTAVGIGGALLVGTLLGCRFGIARDLSLLVSVGTAICGGSAIAAVSPAIRAKDHDVTMALVSVLLLNAIALFVFPAVGHRLHLGQHSFGLWCALAIQDTSSVVGAAAGYGERALEVATAAKLARALWIVPVTFCVSWLRAGPVREAGIARGKPNRPWFILGFLGLAALVTFVPALRGTGQLVSLAAHRVLALTLFLIGLGLSRPALRSLGFRPLLQATLLWFLLAGSMLGAIFYQRINRLAEKELLGKAERRDLVLARALRSRAGLTLALSAPSA
ncbi:MAG: putative sulfate exporter family transporter [Pseudomonadota bacterium]